MKTEEKIDKLLNEISVKGFFSDVKRAMTGKVSSTKQAKRLGTIYMKNTLSLLTVLMTKEQDPDLKKAMKDLYHELTQGIKEINKVQE